MGEHFHMSTDVSAHLHSSTEAPNQACGVEGAWPTHTLLLLKTGVMLWILSVGLEGHPRRQDAFWLSGRLSVCVSQRTDFWSA